MTRTLIDIDNDIAEIRKRLMDSVRGTERWKTAWLYIDKLLDERLEKTQYSARHAKDDDSSVLGLYIGGVTIFYPDVYSGQAGISFAGAPIAMVKATQSDNYTNPDYHAAYTRAQSAKAYFCGYHFLTSGNGAGQADYAFSVVGKTISLMVDWEPTTGSNPVVADAVNFINAYRKLGGITHLLYLPHWYWQQLGSPSLSWFADNGMHLVSSDYTTYTEDGPGWAAYGGMTPAVWQYTASASFNGFDPVDFNAYKGTIEEFEAMAVPVSVTPAPAGLNVTGIAASISWDAVAGADTYQVSAEQLNGKVVDSHVVSGTSTILSGLVHGWTYNVHVSVAPTTANVAVATLQITV